MYKATPKEHLEAKFMKKLSNTDAELKKSVAYKKKHVGQNRKLGNIGNFHLFFF